MEKKKYELNFTILCKDGSRIRESAVTWEDEGLINAENNIAWRYVVVDNPSAKYAGAIIRFDSGREIDGSKKSLKRIPLYIILMEDLWANGIDVDPELANKLRQKFRVTHKDYAKKLEEVINHMKNQSAAEAAEEEKVMNNIDATIENYMEEAEATAVNPIPDFATAVANVEKEEEKIMTTKELKAANNVVLCKVIDRKTNEEKQLFSRIFNILYDSGAKMSELDAGHIVVGKYGSDAGMTPTTENAYAFAREICKDAEFVFGELNGKAIIARLEEIFPELKYGRDGAVLCEVGDILAKYNAAVVNLDNGMVRVSVEDKAVDLPATDSLTFGRKVWANAPKIFGLKTVFLIRKDLENLFGNNKAKQETTVPAQPDIVENKSATAEIKTPESAVKKEEKAMKKFIVTGIGSREIDADGIARVIEIAKMMDEKGFVLRSGGAPGTDSIFEASMKEKEIYLPWYKFNNNKSVLCQLKPGCFAIAETVHPAWDYLSPGAQKLHARNVYQVLGYDLNTLSSVCVCWTSDGVKTEKESSKETGGSRTAIVLADRYHIPVFNLKLDADYEELKKILSSDVMPFKPVEYKPVGHKPAVPEVKASESTVKKEEKKMEETTIDDLLKQEANVMPVSTFSPYLQVHFSILQKGQLIPQVRSITCLDMKDRQRLAAQGKMKEFQLESPKYFIGGLFSEGNKIGSWVWNTAQWPYPSVTIENKKYVFKGDSNGNPTSNMEVLLLAMTEVLGRVKGIKSNIEPAWKRAKRKAENVDVTGQPNRTASAPAVNKKPEPVVASSGPDNIEEVMAFYGEE